MSHWNFYTFMSILRDFFHAIRASKMDSGIAKVLLMLLSRLHKGFDPTELLVVVSKVHIFWELATKWAKISILLFITFYWHYIGQNKVEILQNFVAFPEYMNFKKVAFHSLIFFSRHVTSLSSTFKILYHFVPISSLKKINFKFLVL